MFITFCSDFGCDQKLIFEIDLTGWPIRSYGSYFEILWHGQPSKGIPAFEKNGINDLEWLECPNQSWLFFSLQNDLAFCNCIISNDFIISPFFSSHHAKANWSDFESTSDATMYFRSRETIRDESVRFFTDSWSSINLLVDGWPYNKNKVGHLPVTIIVSKISG